MNLQTKIQQIRGLQTSPNVSKVRFPQKEQDEK